MTINSQYGDDLLSIEEAAKVLRISKDTAYTLAVAGDFPGDAAFKVGRQWRVSLPRLLRALHGAEAAS